MDLRKIFEVCETIGSFSTSNGNFQLHVAFDLDGIDVLSMAVGDLAKVINKASVRYNRIHDSRHQGGGFLSGEDQAWCSNFVDWYDARGQENA